MASQTINRVIILGYLGKNPEAKLTSTGQMVCTFSVATSYDFKDKLDQKQERTEWHTMVAWGKIADYCAKYLKKGQQVYVEGRIQTRSWDDKNATKRYVTEIIVERIVAPSSHKNDESALDQYRLDNLSVRDEETSDDDLPF